MLKIKASHHNIKLICKRSIENTQINIVDFYIEPNYSICSHNTLEITQPNINSENFIESVIELLDVQKIIVIVGDYGCGKSFLSKRIQYELYPKKDIIFIKCSNIANEGFERYRTLRDSAEQRKSENNDLFIIFDGLEELNLLDKQKTGIRDSIIQNIIQLSSEEGFYVIINTRPTLLISSNSSKYDYDLLTNISCKILDVRGEDSFCYFQINYFQRKQIDAFFDSFANEAAKENNEARLSYSQVKEQNKKLLKACKNPLFLYMINLFFYAKDYDISKAKIYLIYEDFVENTIRGKFKGTSLAISELSHDYENYLIDIAQVICSNNIIKYPQADGEEWELDANDNIYSIDLDKLTPKIKNLAEKLELCFESFDQSRLTGNVLTCYFFDISSNQCRFKDNNILFFFLAKSWNNLLNGVSKEMEKNKVIEDIYVALVEQANSYINPAIFDFLLNKLNQRENLPIKSDLVYFLKEIIRRDDFATIPNDSNGKQTCLSTMITVNFVLLILFINLNNKSYKIFENFNVSECIYWYIKASSSFLVDAENILKAMFRRVNLYDASISRLNLNGYNFDYARISKTEFYQAELIETRMNYVHFSNVTFNLCFIKNLLINESYGTIKFNDSRILRLKGSPFTETGDNRKLNIEFENCYIKEIIMTKPQDSDSTPSNINFEFKFCNIDKIIFRNSKSEQIFFNECNYSVLDIDGSNVGKVKLEKTRYSSSLYKGKPYQRKPEIEKI